MEYWNYAILVTMIPFFLSVASVTSVAKMALNFWYSKGGNMLMHIVLFKLKDRTPEGVSKARNKIMELVGRVPQLRSLEVGADIVHAERSFDLALVSTFDSLADLQAYQAHPKHVEVGGFMRPLCESIVSADYEK